jgi:hypothetical protein
MRRREVLFWLLALLAGGWALGEEGKGDKKKSEEEKKSRPVYYGKVEATDGKRVWVGGRSLEVDSPLLPFLAPGMVVGVEDGRLSVLSPGSWAYYQGPRSPLLPGEGRVRVWWAEGRLWHALPTGDPETFLVARYRRGAWEEVPPGVFALPRPGQEGWWLVRLRGLEGKPERLLSER